MVEATGLIVRIQGQLQFHHLHTEFHPNPSNRSDVIKVFYTHLKSLNVRHFGMATATRLKM
jgi:hypothetical protein